MTTEEQIEKVYRDFCALVRNIVKSGAKIKCCKADTINFFINNKHTLSKQSRGNVLRSMRMITQYCRDHGASKSHLKMDDLCNRMADIIQNDTTVAWKYRDLVTIDDDPRYNGLSRRDLAALLVAALYPDDNSY